MTVIAGLSAVPASVAPGEPDGTHDDRMLACLDLPAVVLMTVERTSGTEVVLSASITSDIDASDADVTLIAPQDATLVSGERSGTADLAADRPLVRSWTLELSASSEWAVYCEVRSAGRLMGSASIGLSLSGGEVVEDPSVLAFRTSIAGEVSSGPLAAGAMASPSAVAAGNYFELQCEYYDQGLIFTRFCRGAYTELWLMEGPGHQVVASAHTDNIGRVNFTGIPAGTYQAVVFADGQSGRVTDESGSIYQWTTGSFDVVSGVSLRMSFSGDTRGVWAAYHNMLDMWQWVHDQVAWDASPVTVRYPSLDWPQTDGTIIYIPNTGPAATSIWDRGTMLHEYAHCIMYQMRGGSFPPYIDGSHYVVSEMSEGFALIEGWAEFMQCAVDNDAYGLDVYMGGGNKIIEDLVLADVLDSGDWDGNIIEGAIANAMWDIFDGINVSDAPSWDDSGIGDLVNQQFSVLWSVMLEHSPDSIDEVWEHWPQHDQYLWAVFYHARMNYDLVAPTNPTGATTSPDPGTWTNRNIIWVTLTGASDDATGVAGYWYAWSSTPTDPLGMEWSSDSALPLFVAPDGVWYLCVRAQDWAGNVASGYYYEMWMIDANSPVTTLTLSGADEHDGWYAAGVTVTLSSADNASGTANTWYWVDDWNARNYTGPFTIDSSGSHLIAFYSTDLAGNTGMWSQTILVDGTAPSTGRSVTGTPGNGEWYRSAVTVELRPEDEDSGVALTSYRIGDGPWTTYDGPIALAAEGVHVVQFYSVDVLGNTESTASLTVRIDTISPSTTLQESGTEGGTGWYISEVEVSLAATDDGSGLAVTHYRLNGGLWRNYIAPLTLAEGTHLLEYRSIDTAGTGETVRSETIRVDITAPSITMPANGTVLTASSLHSPWSSADEGSGVSQTYISIDGGPLVSFDPSTSLPALPDGEHELTVKAVDGAGNVAVSSASFRIDTDALSPTGPLGPWLIVALAAAACAAAAAGLVILRRRRA